MNVDRKTFVALCLAVIEAGQLALAHAPVTGEQARDWTLAMRAANAEMRRARNSPGAWFVHLVTSASFATGYGFSSWLVGTAWLHRPFDPWIMGPPFCIYLVLLRPGR